MRARSVSSTLSLLAALLFPLPASAATTVSPGLGTLQAAIDAATPGAVLLLTGGSYVGPVVVDKPLNIACASICLIDANCEAAVALDIASDRVMLRGAGKHGSIQVFRGTDTQIRIANHSKVDLRAGVVGLKLSLNSCGTEQVGIEVSGTSSKVKLLDARGVNNPRAGLLLSGLAARPKVQVRRYSGDTNGSGILVENSAVGSKRGKSGITIDKSTFVDNAVGLAVVGSDGLRVTKSLFIANTGVVGAVGITLDATSDGAVVSKCEWDDRSGTGTSETDAGTGTCGFGNKGFGFPSCS
jgi:nitrous oxidase accessory protein NosD